VHNAEALDRAMRDAIAPLARIVGLELAGADPLTLEPVFATLASGALLAFDELPTQARHLVAFAALTVRALHAAYPDRDARIAEGVALIDDVDLHQDATARRAIVPALREALPNVQWILTTSSPEVTLGCAASDVLALRRAPSGKDVELYEGELALLH
jgi:predicted ATP-binding protein involved in virulence